MMRDPMPRNEAAAMSIRQQERYGVLERNNKIAWLWLGGASIKEIAKKFDISPSSVSRIGAKYVHFYPVVLKS